MLEGAVLLLFVLACANVAALLFARTTTRQPELSLCLALGAGRPQDSGHTTRRTLDSHRRCQCYWYSLAWFASRLIGITADANLPRIAELSLDRGVLFLAVAFTGVVIVVQVESRCSPRLRVSQGSCAGTGRYRWPSAPNVFQGVIALEIGAAFALVVAVVLLSRSYIQLTRVDPGYDPNGLLTVSLVPAGISSALRVL